MYLDTSKAVSNNHSNRVKQAGEIIPNNPFDKYAIHLVIIYKICAIDLNMFIEGRQHVWEMIRLYITITGHPLTFSKLFAGQTPVPSSGRTDNKIKEVTYGEVERSQYGKQGHAEQAKYYDSGIGPSLPSNAPTRYL